MITEYYTPQEVAEKLHFSRKFVYDLMRKGELGYSKLGNGRGSRIRISSEDVKEFMEYMRHKPLAQEE